ncbi:hypothetical protein P43SY_005522 [Pythium insidiosum]|uniref:RRM domain-containing protein n=1 Tax=Pythium insidiosum TaxID=114742 RepID=A0AAD5M670_PYTIN|nr:hypothetical protein P43SY_005522 [Pythium insidiosum]
MTRRRPNNTAERNVRVYTVNHESRYVIVRNVPAIGVVPEALARLQAFGAVESHRVLANDPGAEPFTQSLWVQFESEAGARLAKARAKQTPLYGSILQVTYAPESETVADTAAKLRARRELLEERARPTRARRDLGSFRGGSGGNDNRCARVETTDDERFIGPRLPTPSEMAAAAATRQPAPPSVPAETVPASTAQAHATPRARVQVDDRVAKRRRI